MRSILTGSTFPPDPELHHCPRNSEGPPSHVVTHWTQHIVLLKTPSITETLKLLPHIWIHAIHRTQNCAGFYTNSLSHKSRILLPPYIPASSLTNQLHLPIFYPTPSSLSLTQKPPIFRSPPPPNKNRKSAINVQLCTHHLNRNQTEDLQVSATTTPAIPPTFNISIIPSGQPTIPQKQPATPIVKYLLSIRYAGFPKPDIHASGRRQDRSSCDARIILPLEASSSGKGYTIYPASYKPTCAIASPSSAQMLALYHGIQHPISQLTPSLENIRTSSSGTSALALSQASIDTNVFSIEMP